MKKISLSVLVASAMFFSVQNISAQEGEPQKEVEIEETVVQRAQEEYSKIEIDSLPELVQEAVARDFSGATISEAFVNEQSGVKKYKIKVTTAEGDEKDLFADDQGNWIDEQHLELEKE